MADPREPHAGHDPLVIAALLDRDIGAEERAIGESRIASCASCAALHTDLLALSAATRAHPTPTRPRAFTLTGVDAARLAGEAAREPGAGAARLGGVMTDPTPSDHAVHDTMLVASLADHSLAASERTAAEALVAACGQCADLHADLLALRVATRAMPTPTRPNDYMLTARDAVRLRSRGWRRFVAILGTSRDALSRPLAVGLTTLGLAGLLVANVPSFSFYSGGATSAPMVGAPAGGGAVDTGDGSTTQDASAAAEAAASAAAVRAAAPAASAAPAFGNLDGSAIGASAAPAPVVPGLADAATPPPDTQGATNGSSKGQGGAPGRGRDTTNDFLLSQEVGGVSPLVVLSVAFLITGLGLFALRWTARRFAGD